ncbi:hypothetical protein MFM001_46350 [Mycobacterium sp. MFM001]|nr:hypothetical protein MFM001_46350 [Mycobacterium sp. MFM001]
MNIISTYREVGTYRAAAELCGTTHKTVKRAVERAEAGGGSFSSAPLLWLLAIDAALGVAAFGAAMCAVAVRYRTDG